MERDAVERVVPLITHEIIIFGRNVRVRLDRPGRRALPGLASPSVIKRAERITARDLARNQKVLLAQFSRTRAGRGSPVCQSVDGDLDGLVDTDGVDVERLDRHAREDLQLRHHARLPFAQTVLKAGELGQLALPVRVHTKGLHVAVLVKVRLEAAVVLALEVDDGRVFEPELGELARVVAGVADLEEQRACTGG